MPGGWPVGVRTTRRRGRMSDTKRAALTDLGPRFHLSHTAPWTPRALDDAFGAPAPWRMLDIGCGTGEATVAWAEAHPDAQVVAVELHRPGVAQLLTDLDRLGLGNVRICEADAVVLLDDVVGAGCFDEVRILFPDPWPKRRHVSRRLVDATLVRRLADLVPVGGRLAIATDWLPYADQVRAAIAAEPRWAPQVEVVDDPPSADEEADGEPVGPRWRSERPERPETAYERRGRLAERTITDLVATRVDAE